MVKCLYYRENELIKLLKSDFKVICINSKYHYDDYSTTEENYYITNRNDIDTIDEWNGLWTAVNVKFTDGSKVELLSDNVNGNDKLLLRVTKNNFLSPAFRKRGEHIQVSQGLVDWLVYNEVTKEQLDSITDTFEMYPKYVFENIKHPVIEDGKVRGYTTANLELSEDIIDTALNDIQDIEMRLKLEAIIKSFKCIYK